ncbi:MAG: hypothetical protein HY601_02740 [Candidatus Omnitrophica bacterium]|nr:hypothetical protein [Candidatus Omnitrophota bacterium]
MRRSGIVAGVLLAALAASTAEARERPIEELPKDLLDIAFVWTEPIKQVAEQSRRFDPVSGLWFGLVDGSVKSVERTAKFFLYPDGGSAETPEASKQFQYSF